MSKPSSSTNVRTGLGFAELKQAVLDHLMYTMARPVALAETRDFYHALALAVRDRMQHHWMDSVKSYYVTTGKVACYLSAEFLMGPHLGNNLVNLGIENEARQAMAELGQPLTEVLNCEEEPGLGNGGLGRLAACYLDSLATLQRPAIGYGIRYEFGIFDQEIHDGWQTEITDKWLHRGNPWEIAKPQISFLVNWGGTPNTISTPTGYTRCAGFPRAWSRAWPMTRLFRGMA